MSSFIPEGGRRSRQSNKRKQRKWFDLSEGIHTVRILDEQTTLKYVHWVRPTYVECLGDECPLCQMNQEILAQVDGDWGEAKKVSGFNPWQQKYYVNVLDRTRVKVCPDCGHENKANLENRYKFVCSECGTSITGVQETESNEVKILYGGKTLFEVELDTVDKTTTRATGEYVTHTVTNPNTGQEEQVKEEVREKIGITNYDVNLRVVGTGRERQVTPIPQVHRDDELDISDDELFDLSKVVINLSPSEIVELRRGVSLKDIFAARRAQEKVEASDNQTVTSETTESESLKTINALLDRE